MENIDRKQLAFTLSHSSMELLEKCPYAWFQRYVMKFYPSVDRNVASEFGGLFHEVAEVYTGTGKEEIILLVDKLKCNYHLDEEYSKKIPVAINNFHYFYEKFLRNAKKIYREKRIEILLNQFLALIGSLDVLYQTEGGNWVITDYKSSKKPGDYSVQLSCYFYLLSCISKTVPKEIKCQVVYLAAEKEENIIQEYTIDLQDLEICQQRLLTLVNKISILDVDNVAMWKKRPSALCPWCDYFKAGICEGNSKKI